jgi:long-subunit fatty acid transport protein
MTGPAAKNATVRTRLKAAGVLGSANGPGFGWRDITAVKIGANYRIDSAWQVRAATISAAMFAGPTTPNQLLDS